MGHWIDDLTLWQACVGAWKSFWSSARIAIGCGAPWDNARRKQEGRGYLEFPVWAWVVSCVPNACTFGLIQAYGCWFALRPGWPGWPLRVIGWMEDRIEAWRRRRERWYVWLPADSGDPREVAFHALAESVEYLRDAEGVRLRDEGGRPLMSRRPRMYVYDAEGVEIPEGATTVTYATGSTVIYHVVAGAA